MLAARPEAAALFRDFPAHPDLAAACAIGGFRLGLETEQGGDRPKGFLAGHFHLGRDVGQHGRLVKITAAFMPSTARQARM